MSNVKTKAQAATTTKEKKGFKAILKPLLFTLLCLFIWRLGVHIQIPFVELGKEYADGTNGSIFGFLDIFSGGALSSFSVLALGISPYITASIIIQLLQMDIIPAFKEWSEEGEAGKAKLNRWTRYLALFLAFVQSLALVIGFKVTYGGQVFEYPLDYEFTAVTYVYMSLVLTAGTAFVLWLADQITMYGVGNGSSLMIVAGIIASFPSMFITIFDKFLGAGATADGATITWTNYLLFILVILIFLLIIAGVVFMEGLMRKIPIQNSSNSSAAKLLGNQKPNIPLKLNSASVIPVIFAATLMSLPMTFIQMLQPSSMWWEIIFNYHKPIGFVIYIALIFVFAFFYSFLQISPEKMAENLKKQNSYIPGVAHGEPTANYISKVLFKITLLGATYLAVIASLPMIMTKIFDLDASVQLGGTSMMIVVGVAVETFKQIKDKTSSQAKDYRKLF